MDTGRPTCTSSEHRGCHLLAHETMRGALSVNVSTDDLATIIETTDVCARISSLAGIRMVNYCECAIQITDVTVRDEV
jgi:hypothetical protein